MLRRSILEISSRRSIPLYLSSRKEFSTASQSNSPENPPNSGGNLSKVFIGSIALGVAGITAYQTGYFDKVLTKEQNNDLNTNPLPIVHEEPEKSVSEEQVAVENVKDSEILSPPVDNSEKGIETDPYYGKREEENQSEIEKLPILEPQDVISGQEGDLPISTSDSYDAIAKIQEDLGANSQDLKSTTEEHEEVQSSSILNEVAPVLEANEIKSEGILSNDNKEPDALLDEYLLKDKAEESAPVSSYPEKEIAEAVMGNNDIYVANDGKIEKYDKELKDARARELMYAERETILDKELHKEKVKAAAALKSLQEKLEEEFRMEIEKKESEAELEVMKLKDLAKAELAAAIASEKASQIEKMEEANLNINALCMAFYARSEEARQTHSVHKLALGALALEDALSKGLPIEKEIEALKSYIDGIDKDSLLGLVIASLPEDTLKNGTDTILQLNHKFDGLKGTLRHFSLMPPGGGGILAHSLAYIASVLKVKEADKSGDGIESVINRVESLLADGKLLEAAETLENGLKGSQATEVVGDWIHQARNRAITEQALTLLQSYATSASYT
uniref:MICOS complex subunit MIC60 n=1 Tax=Lactuca sativa TaxID=4236 RepID=A0A9R1VCZ1_LACSA|nr:hypothetical protein LSAT_V11C500244110 [Lactuca sativa]